MIDKEVIYKERMYAENQLKEKSGSNIVVEWMSEIKELAKNGYEKVKECHSYDVRIVTMLKTAGII